MRQKIKEITRKIPTVILLTAAAALVEIFVFNLSAWTSLTYGEKEKIAWEEVNPEGAERTEEGAFLLQDGSCTLPLPIPQRAEGVTIHNLYFDLGLSKEEIISYTVTLTDEGNSYPYSLPEQQLSPLVEKSRYTRLYPSGKVGELSVRFTAPEGCALEIRGIYANVRVPVRFQPLRFLTFLFFLLLFYAMRRPGFLQEPVCFEKKTRRWRTQLIITAATALLLMGMAYRLSHVNPVCIASPWPHHKQYQELAQAMARGRLYLDVEPSEGLKNAPNPYDTIYLQANGIDYQADYAYYGGKYYVYFGIVPELLFYLPCYLLTGKLFPNWMAVFFLFCGFIAAVFGLYREIVRRWFPGTPFIVSLLMGILTVCCGNLLFVIARPDLYDTPIMAAVMFTVAGLFFWIRGKYAASPVKRRSFLFLGSLCMALVAGCRPQLLLFSFAALPLFWDEVMKERSLFGRRSVWETACLCLPYVLVAAGIMYYNAARFGSPFDFGAAYSLTSNDMTKRSFNLHQTLLGLWHFFLQPPIIGADFPFLQGNQIASASYMGKLNAEYTYGGILLCNAFTWVLLSAGRWKTELKRKGIYGLFLVNLVTAAVLCVVDVTGAGILERYMVDVIWGVLLSSSFLWLALFEKTKGTGAYRTAVTLLFAVCVLQAAYGFGVVMGNGDLSVNVRSSNPLLYLKIKALLSF